MMTLGNAREEVTKVPQACSIFERYIVALDKSAIENASLILNLIFNVHSLTTLEYQVSNLKSVVGVLSVRLAYLCPMYKSLLDVLLEVIRSNKQPSSTSLQ